ncbi:heat shock protein beta-9 [Nothobranchius furzeri]|uniref:LOC107374147-like protein n=2 Tax=Nothobranchius TaxID=28779 RepID=A0A8C6M851_NOTFU|nr:putative LOC107374147-like protein [Nothobranchius furzeri]
MASRFAALSNLFDVDSLLSQEQLLWPLHHEALSSVQKNFFNQRAKMAESLCRELFHGPQLLSFNPFSVMHSTLARQSDDRELDSDSTEQHEDTSDKKVDLLVTLDARGYAPNDITVKLDGRSLAITAIKQTGEEEIQSCSSSSSSASCSSSASAQMSFVQNINLPAHLDLCRLSCCLMDDGQLRIHAPVNKQPINKEHTVPTRYRTSLEFPITKDDEALKD